MEASTTGRGTLSDPEIYGHIPGHIIPIVEREFDDFDSEAEARYLNDLAVAMKLDRAAVNNIHREAGVMPLYNA